MFKNIVVLLSFSLCSGIGASEDFVALQKKIDLKRVTLTAYKRYASTLDDYAVWTMPDRYPNGGHNPEKTIAQLERHITPSTIPCFIEGGLRVNKDLRFYLTTGMD